ncbi:unnamed protein product [Rotaria sp. Silwood1]|nr:unnamed protein product [Rotaria sp. Silwood1]CAF1126058.1 unnamed protein product [Rotaria sp. Silwood1]CAF1252903.1 unnamed protein product [Rotaria sp. Silwood1]CAF3460618.1 unnamed protein product [Rotaria sp. Silwood1]CAF3466039.1 unnamed protein product [Rotaria sp. Silwood1]
MSAPTSSDRNQESPNNPLGAPGVEAQQKLGQQGSSDSSAHQLGEGGSGQRHLLGEDGSGRRRLLGEGGSGQQQHKLGQDESGQHQNQS